MGSCVPSFRAGQGKIYLFALWTNGLVEMQFQHMKLAPFDEVDRRMEFIRRLNTIPGISIAEDAHSRRPSFSLSLLATPAAQTTFTEALTWALTEIQAQALST